MFTPSTRRPRLLGGIAVAALSFASCGGGDSANLDAFCDKYEELDSAASVADDPDGMLNAIRDVVNASPDEIKTEMQRALAATEVIAEAAEKVRNGEDVDFESLELDKAGDDLDAVGDTIDEYVETNCGSLLSS